MDVGDRWLRAYEAVGMGYLVALGETEEHIAAAEMLHVDSALITRYGADRHKYFLTLATEVGAKVWTRYLDSAYDDFIVWVEANKK